MIFGIAAILLFLLLLPLAAMLLAPAPSWVGPAPLSADPPVVPWIWLAALIPLGMPVLAFALAHALVHGSGAAKTQAGWLSAIGAFAVIHLAV